MDTLVKALPAVGTVLSAAIPAAMSLTQKTPKVPKLDVPTLKQTPTMPTPNDDAAKAAGLKQIALNATKHGRTSTDLYEKLG